MGWRAVRIAAALVGAHVCSPVSGTAEEIDWEAAREFWAFRAPELPALPAVRDEGWIRNDIDRFILWRLERDGLRPEAEADEKTLMRRLTFDLTGLPPSHEGFPAELVDEGPESYRPLVDALLSSPRFGERLASLWLPVARYAEDQPVGRHTSFPGAPRYRQWVIDAFNRDLPYDEFVRLQLAADLVGNADDRPALGFLALGPYPPSGSTVEERADAWADRVDLVTRGLLGLSVACARCHDHLDDPISAEDYYGFAGIFASIEHDVLYENEEYTHVVSDAVLRNLRVFKGGDPDRPGELVPRRNVRLLSPSPDLSAYQDGSGRRELAVELTARSNPVLARVLVNRVWGEVFGQYLVATPSNFGRSGEPPTHPELLDWLAVRFMENGWSMKWLMRELVTSATYRQETVPADSPGLASYAGMKRRRLTAEMIRDSMLVASGELDLRPRSDSARLDDPDNLRRAVFGEVSRLTRSDFLKEFDYPDPALHAPRRDTTITPTQKLFLLNSRFVRNRADKLAAFAGDQRIEEGLQILYRRLFSRAPTDEEREIAERFLNAHGSGRPAWEQLSQVLLSSNAFLYRD